MFNKILENKIELVGEKFKKEECIPINKDIVLLGLRAMKFVNMMNWRSK